MPAARLCAIFSAVALALPAQADLHYEAPVSTSISDASDPLAELLMAESSGGGTAAPASVQPAPRQHYGLHLVNTARSQTGTPYRLGAHTPGRGFDCSGFVWWVFKQQGIAVPRVTTELARVGTKVERNDLQPGDIVVFRTGRGPNGLHTGILTTEGRFIHAPRTGQRVKESSLSGYWASHFYTARRVAGLRMPANEDAVEQLLAEAEAADSTSRGVPPPAAAPRAGVIRTSFRSTDEVRALHQPAAAAESGAAAHAARTGHPVQTAAAASSKHTASRRKASAQKPAGTAAAKNASHRSTASAKTKTRTAVKTASAGKKTGKRRA